MQQRKTNEDIIIREAKIKDKDDILSIIGSYPLLKWDKSIAQKYYDDYFSEKKDICLKGDAVYVGEVDNKVIGVIGYFLDRYETLNCWLGWFYVHKDHQNKGYGTKLLDFIVEELKNKKVKKLFVDTSSDNAYKEALNFYLKRDFKKVTEIKDYYGIGEHQIILSRMF